MEHEDFCTFEQSIKLKKLGFDWKCYTFYHWDNWCGLNRSGIYENHNMFEKCVSAPTLSQAQKWLREVKKIYVFSHIIGNPPRDKCKYYWKVETNNSRTVDSSAITELSLTYEQALSAGLDKALDI